MTRTRAMKTALVLLGAAGLTVASSAYAHHSFAAYDNDRQIVVEGVVREFKWANPHGKLFLTITENGQQSEFEIELSSLNSMSRQGWNRNSVKTGDRVKATVHPYKDGAKGGSFMSLVKADGTYLGPTAPP